jgi:hypothetical protein
MPDEPCKNEMAHLPSRAINSISLPISKVSKLTPGHHVNVTIQI